MFRLASIKDIDEIMEIVKKSVEIMQKNGNDQWNGTYPNREQFLIDIKNKELHLLEDDVILGLVVINKNEPIEYSYLNWVNEEFYVIHRLVINPDFKGKKIGIKLMNYIEEYAINNNIFYIKSDTYSKNKNALVLFEKTNYSYIGDVNFRGKEAKFKCFYKKLNLKKILRKKMSDLRDSIIEKEKNKNDKSIFNSLINNKRYIEASSIFVFVSYKSEVDTFEFIKYSIKNGKTIYVPKIDGKEMDVYKINSLEDLSVGYMGILEPKLNCVKYIENGVDLIIVPGLAFDEKGARLGYGGGYYDRFFKKNSGYKLAIAYDIQLIDFVPVEAYDVFLDELITNKKNLIF